MDRFGSQYFLLILLIFFTDSSITAKTGGCFPRTSTLLLEDGRTKSMEDVEVGDVVLSTSKSGDVVFSPVIMFLHRDEDAVSNFVHFVTSQGHRLIVSHNHLVQIDVEHFVFASTLRVGDHLVVYDNHTLLRDQIASVATVVKRGVYAPLTSEGTVVVDGVAASCYAHVSSHLTAHTAMFPARWTSIFTAPSTQKGVHWYVQMLHDIAHQILPSSMLYNS
jgi:hypothetical protein